MYRFFTVRNVLINITIIALLIICFYIAYKPNEYAYITAPVIEGDIKNEILTTGKIDAFERVNVGAQVSGQVKALHVKVGQLVHKGQLIAEIDDLPQHNDLRIAEAALNASRAERISKLATMKQANFRFERQKRMLAEGVGSRQDFENAEANFSMAKADLLTLDARIVQAVVEVNRKKIDLSYTKISAPVDGTVIAIVTKQGQTVNSNQSAPVIVKLAQLDKMIIKAQISEADITHVWIGQNARFSIFSDPNIFYQAKLDSIEMAPESVLKEDSTSGNSSSSSNSSNSSSVYYNALFYVDNPHKKFKISMTAQLSLLREERKNVLLIPSQAVNNSDPKNRFVTILDNNEKILSREVQLGITDGVNIQVISGLAKNDRVILGQNESMTNNTEGMF